MTKIELDDVLKIIDNHIDYFDSNEDYRIVRKELKQLANHSPDRLPDTLEGSSVQLGDKDTNKDNPSDSLTLDSHESSSNNVCKCGKIYLDHFFDYSTGKERVFCDSQKDYISNKFEPKESLNRSCTN